MRFMSAASAESGGVKLSRPVERATKREYNQGRFGRRFRWFNASRSDAARAFGSPRASRRVPFASRIISCRVLV